MYTTGFLIVLCLAMAAEASSDSGHMCYKCEDGFYIYKRRCYKEVTSGDSGEPEFSYQQAKDGCEERNAKLVSISSQRENDFVASLLSPGSFQSWIGLTIDQPNTEASCDAVCRREGWEWIDNSDYVYKSWGVNMPFRERNCAAIDSRGIWMAFDCMSECESNLPCYVCEKAAVPTQFCSCDCEKESESGESEESGPSGETDGQ